MVRRWNRCAFSLNECASVHVCVCVSRVVWICMRLFLSVCLYVSLLPPSLPPPFPQVADKVKGDAIPRKFLDRFVLVESPESHASIKSTWSFPGRTHTEYEPPYADIIARLQSCALATLTSRVAQYEMEIKRKYEQKSLPGWNFCVFFFLKESLAFLYAQVGAVPLCDCGCYCVMCCPLRFGCEWQRRCTRARHVSWVLLYGP